MDNSSESKTNGLKIDHLKLILDTGNVERGLPPFLSYKGKKFMSRKLCNNILINKNSGDKYRDF